MLRCNLCPEDDPTTIPYDEVGVALMTQHLESAHDVRVSDGRHQFDVR